MAGNKYEVKSVDVRCYLRCISIDRSIPAKWIFSSFNRLKSGAENKTKNQHKSIILSIT